MTLANKKTNIIEAFTERDPKRWRNLYIVRRHFAIVENGELSNIWTVWPPVLATDWLFEKEKK